MFNALRIGRIDADDQTGIPSDMDDAPPRIKSIRIDHHPFDDLVKTAEVKIPWKEEATTSKDGKGGGDKQTTVEKRRKKRKGKRDLNVLSFGDEERDMEATSNSDLKRSNILSSHDVLSKESEFLSSNVDEDVHKKANSGNEEDRSNAQRANVSRLEKKPKVSLSEHVAKPVADSGNGEVKFTKSSRAESSKAKESTDERHVGDESKKQRKPKVSAVEARRAKYLKTKSGRKKRESDTMAKLFQFKSKVIETKGALRTESNSDSHTTADNSLAARMAKRAKQSEEDQERRKQEEEEFRSMPGYSGKVNDDQTETETSDWMNTKFKCKQHIDGDKRLGAMDKMGAESKGGDGRSMDEYVVLDEKRHGKKSQRKRERHEKTHRRRA